MIENGPKMDRKWTENGPKKDRKRTENRPNTDQKRTKNGPKMDQKWTNLPNLEELQDFYAQNNLLVK